MNITKNQPDALNYQVTIDIAPDDYAEALKKRLNEYRRRADITFYFFFCSDSEKVNLF